VYPITTIEEIRLRRAFIRYEIFRRVFIEAITPTFRPIPMTQLEPRAQRWKKFFQPFLPWEREELLSIHEFSVGFVRDLYIELQDYIIEQLSKMATERVAYLQELQIPIKRVTKTKVTWFLDDACFGIFEYPRNTLLAFRHLIMRGLPFIGWFSRLPWNDRIRVYGEHFAKPINTTLFDAFCDIYDELSSMETMLQRPVRDNNSHLNSRMKGGNGQRLMG
jgi:hypothetical protein